MGFVYLDQAVIEWKAVEVVHIPLEVGHLDNLVFGIELVERDFLQVESKFFLKVALSLSLSLWNNGYLNNDRMGNVLDRRLGVEDLQDLAVLDFVRP